MTIGSLFSGIGGLELGLERAGFGPVLWQVESNPFCRRVLEAHWPGVERHPDIERFTGAATVDIVCGGFPCQDLSNANTSAAGRAGLDGDRSGLWREFARVVGECRPRWVIVENASAWQRWMQRVRTDFACLGYGTVPLVLSAGFVGAPHSRPRGFVVAYSDGNGKPLGSVYEALARLQADAGSFRDFGSPPSGAMGMDDGIPDWMDRVAALGNSACPDVAELIGQAIQASDMACGAA